MLILLPPSEGKTAPRRGKPLDLAALSAPQLTGAREQVLESLIRLCAGDPSAARDALGLSAGQQDEVDGNTRLRTAPTAPAAQIYTGVLYEALDLATLPAPAMRMMRKSLKIFSSLWGVLGIADRIPAYRCPAGARLPGMGGLGPFWRRHLPTELGTGLVVDLRSGPYATMWRPAGEHVTVRVLHNGTVVSHFNKATKGRLVRDLAVNAVIAKNASQLVRALRDLKYTVEAEGSRLDVVVTSL